ITGSMQSPYAYDIKATNPNEGALTFVLQSGPDGMTVDRDTGTVLWMPSFTGQRVRIAVADGRGGKVIHGYQVPVSTVLAPSAPVRIGGEVRSAGFASVDVPEGVQIMQVTLRTGSGDVALLVSDPNQAAQISSRAGSNQTLTFENPRPGRWNIEVDGVSR